MLTLDVYQRSKGNVKTLRKKGFIPAVVYGKNIENLLIEIPYLNFKKIYKEAGEGTIIELNLNKDQEKEKTFLTLIREVQKNPISEEYLHADFYQLPLEEEIETTIPLIFEDEVIIEKELGGILIKPHREIKIKALAQNLIPFLKVNLSLLKNIGDKIKIKDLSPSNGIEILANPEEIIALIEKPEEEKIETAPVEEKIEEIEVIKKKKEIEEESEETSK